MAEALPLYSTKVRNGQDGSKLPTTQTNLALSSFFVSLPPGLLQAKCGRGRLELILGIVEPFFESKLCALSLLSRILLLQDDRRPSFS